MSSQGQWQVAGSAAEIYERLLVPAVFAAWAPLVVALGDPKPFPSAARLVQDYVAGSPLAGHVAKASDDARAALVSEVVEALRSYEVGGVFSFPIEAQLASAKK